MEFFATIALVLQISLVPLFACMVCFVVDTVINVQYFLWNREMRVAKPVCDELVNVEQYDFNFYDDGK